MSGTPERLPRRPLNNPGPEQPAVAAGQQGLSPASEDLAPTLRDQNLPQEVAGRDWLRLDGYDILRELGRGGMGVVYLARERELDRPVALKMILAGSHATPQDLARLRAEAEAVARLQHPGIVQIYAVGQIEGRPYLALEYCAGGSLEALLDGRPMPPRRAAALVEALARAMQHAHERGIIHRDLKPANILLAAVQGAGLSSAAALSDPGSLFPKISDFGLAKRTDLAPGLTNSGAIMGTPSYMAPEQAGRRRRPLDARVDVYALGAVLYELVTGRPPFQGETVLDTLEQVVREEVVPPTRLRPGCPRDLETVILKCLRKEPRHRYSSASALAEDCAAFAQGRPIKARATAAWERALAWARRRPACAAVLLCGCAALAALVGVLAWHTTELKGAVAAARAQEQAAQLSRSRAEAQALLVRAEAALARGAWEEARLQADKALTVLDAGADAAELTCQAERLRGACQRHALEEAARRDVQRRYHTFLATRDEALFHASLFTGLDATTNLARTREAALAALAQFSLAGDSSGTPALTDPNLGDRERAEVLAGRQELLLALAEALAHPLPGQSAETRRTRLEEAVRLLQSAPDQGPAATRAQHLRLARYLEQLGRKAEADSHRTRAWALEPSGAADYFLMGDERQRQGELAQACRDFESALRLQPQHFWAQYGLALGCLRRERLAEARAGLTACLSQRPRFAWLYALRGFANGELGESAAAEADFDTALSLAASTDETTRYGVFANRGVLRFRQAEAAEGLTGVRALGPSLPPCAVYGGLGCLLQHRRLGEAVEDLQAAIRLKPRSYQAHVSLAQVRVRQGRPADARAEFDEAVRLAPHLADLYRTRADFACQCQDWAAATRDLQQAVRLEPARGRVTAEDHFKLGQLSLRDRNYQGAIRACEAALALTPGHTGALRLQAVALLELRRYEEAARALDQYLTRTGPPAGRSALAEAYRLRGLTRTQLGRYEGALHDYTRALEVQPDSATRCYRGWIYLVQGAPQLALADFEEALRLDPGAVDARIGRGNARARLGRWQEAVADADAALKQQTPSARTLRSAAAVYAQAAGADTQPDRQLYQGRALDLLAQAIAAVPPARRAQFWGEQVHGDRDLDPIRQLPRFQRMTPHSFGPSCETRGTADR